MPCSTADVCRIVGYTLDSNEKALSLARNAGFVISWGVRGIIQLEGIGATDQPAARRRVVCGLSSRSQFLKICIADDTRRDFSEVSQ